MDDAPAARWFTYRELAAETGLTPRAAEARARRMVKAGKWRHRIDNDPPNAARVLVTETELNAMRDQGPGGGTDPLPQGSTEGDAQGGIDPPTINALLAEIKAAHEQVAGELRRRAEVAETRAEAAEGETVALREQIKAERDRAVTWLRETEAARDAARSELAEWTAGGPLARAVRGFLNRRGRR